MRYGDATKVLPNVQCPYFISVTEKSISCEGVEHSKSVVQKFSTKELTQCHLQKYCYRYPNKCPIARIIDEKYEV